MNIRFMERAVNLALESVQRGGGPFGAVAVKDNEIVGEGTNSVTLINDPTAHAEIMAIRAACRKLGSFRLTDVELYTTCEPCPMCLGAILWARLLAVYYACTREDAATYGFDDQHFHHEVCLPPHARHLRMRQAGRERALQAFYAWRENPDKQPY